MLQSNHNIYSVVYDMQSGNYYKIHKLNGYSLPTHRNGTPLYTKPNMQDQGVSQPSKFKTKLNENLIYEKSISNSEAIGLSNNNDRQSTSSLTSKGINFKNLLINQEEPKSPTKELKKILLKNDSQTLDVSSDRFYNTISQFNQLKQEKFHENHSIKKEIPGSHKKVSPDKIDLSNHKFHEFSQKFTIKKEQEPSSPIRPQLVKVIPHSDHHIKKQYYKQREIFLKSNLIKTNKTPQKPFQQMRKENMKRIEDQNINYFTKKTSKVYQ